MNQLNNFRCKIHDHIFKDCKNMLTEKKTFEKCCYGGGASGKSISIANNIVYWLPEIDRSESLVIVNSSLHKQQTKELFKDVLTSQGFNYRSVANKSGDEVIFFGNLNKITIRSVETSSIEALTDKFKTGATLKGKIMFLWFEEFTAVLTSLRTLDNFNNAKARLKRQLIENCNMILYSYNPTKNRVHPINEFEKTNRDYIEFHFSTIYDLPKKWQDKGTLEEAEKLKVTNPTAYKHIYLGQRVGTEGMAFNITDKIWTNLSAYDKFFVQSDEGTINATTWCVFGIKNNGETHLITNFYHSSKDDGKKYSQDSYAKKLIQFLKDINLKVDVVYTDGVAFAEALKDNGQKAKSVHRIKNRVLGYALMNNIIIDEYFKIVRRPENEIAFIQFNNATIDTNKDGKDMVSKKKEASNNNDFHAHIVDCCMYMCLVRAKELMKGEYAKYR